MDEKNIIFCLCIIGVILLGWCLWHSTSYMLRIEITPYTTNGDVVRAVYPHCIVRRCKIEDGGKIKVLPEEVEVLVNTGIYKRA